MSRYYSYETIKNNAKDVILKNGVKHRCIDPDALLDIEPADVVEVGKWCDMREYILEMQADENGHNEFFRIIKLDDELKERITNEIELAILYGVDR